MKRLSVVFLPGPACHFHMQFHKGSAMIWHNLDSRRLSVQVFRSNSGASLAHVDNWPAHVFLATGRDNRDVARIVCQLVGSFTKRGKAIRYNLGVRCHDGETSVLVVPRSAQNEK